MTIYGIKTTGQACTKIPYKGYEISIAMDDSCGAYKEYSRSSIAVFKGADCVSHEFFDGIEIDATAENLIAIFSRIDGLTNVKEAVDFNHDVAHVPGQEARHILMRRSDKSLCGAIDRAQGLSYDGAWDSGERANCLGCKRLWKSLREKAKREETT